MRWAVFAGFLLFAVVAAWPLSHAGLGGTGIAARKVSGNIWRGRLEWAQIGGIELGDVEGGLALLSLLAGTLRADFAGDRISGTLVKRRDGIAVVGLNGRIGPAQIGGFPISFVDFAMVDLAFAGDVCTQARGQIIVQPGGIASARDPLRGSPRCDGTQVTVSLASTSGHERLVVRGTPSRRYHAVLTLGAVNEAERAGLLATGFQPTPQGLALTIEGAF